MYEKEKKWNVTTKKLWVLVLILNFAYNAIKFLNAEGNADPVVWALFNIVISLGFLIINFHNEDLKENKIFKQSLLTDFFNKIK